MNNTSKLISTYNWFADIFISVRNIKGNYNIKYGVVRHIYKVLIKVIRFNSFFHLDYLNALFLIVFIEINTKIWKKRLGIDSKNKRLKVLAFNREGFWKDLVEIDKRTDLDVIYFPQAIYTFYANAFLPGKLQSQLAYHVKDSSRIIKSIWIRNEIGKNIINEKTDYIYKQNLRESIRRIFDILHKTLGFDAILSSHIQYYQDQEWINVAEERGTPFVVLVKEGYGNKDQCQAQLIALAELEFKFHGALIGTHCATLKEMFLKAGVVDSAEKIIVTGAARTDAIMGHFVGYGDKPKVPDIVNNEEWIVFFDFFHFHNMALIDSYIDLQVLWEETLAVLVKLSGYKEGRNVKIIAKTKLDVNTIALNTYLKNKYGSNTELIVDDKLEFGEIAQKASMIVGFRTTALIEFMGMDVPIVILNWAEAEKNSDVAMFTDKNNKAYLMANSKNEFENIIKKHLENKVVIINEKKIRDQRVARDKIINDHLYIIDGKRSEFISNMIKKAVDKHKMLKGVQ